MPRFGLLQTFEEWLQRGSIQSQTGRVFNLFALLVLILGAVATIGAARIEQRSASLANLTDVAFLTGNMARTINTAKNQMGAYHSRGREPDQIAAAMERAVELKAMNLQLGEALAAVESKQIGSVDLIGKDIDTMAAILEEVRAAPDAIIDQESFLGPKYDAIDILSERVVAVGLDVSGQVEQLSDQGLTEIKILISALAAGLMIGLALVFLGKRMVASRIVAPIVAISDASQRIAQGDATLELPSGEREDEIGTLATALNVLRQVQRKAAEEAQREHARELERERELQAERERQRSAQDALLKSLADQFEMTISDVAAEVAAASDQMHSAAVELSRHVEDSSKTVHEANANLKQASAGITGAASASDEFAMSITEVSRQATSSSERARKASEAANRADATVAILTGSADRISQIIEVIAGIAQRTNLLALNASIEAARGGEAGRGFAVVASEVKELAVQTARATQEVETLIRDMQTSTGESATALGLIAQEVVALETTAMAIASAVDQQAVAGQDLARSIDLAARNTATVSATIDDVSKISMTSGTTASQVRESSASLSRQSTKLREQVGQFLKQVRAA